MQQSARPTPRAARDLGYERVALVLQGGGALGAYQAGVYEALHEAGIEPDVVAGISIGAVNAALIVGNPPGRRVERLREFWETVSEPGLAWPLAAWPMPAAIPGTEHGLGELARLALAAQSLLRGQLGFFTPRIPPPWARVKGDPGATSFYDADPLAETLRRLVDFARVNAGGVRLALGAVNVRTGNFVYFDSAERPLGPAHVMASGALPPGFAPVEIDGEHYWDGGLVSNTPLEYVVDGEPYRDTLAFQVDLWSARGRVPETLLDALERDKDIRYSSRTRRGTDALAARQRVRRAIGDALEALPLEARTRPAVRRLEAFASVKVMNVIHLIYQAKWHGGYAKDYEFGPDAMAEHWRVGLEHTRRTLAEPRVLAPPPPELGVVTHDLHRASDPGATQERSIA